MRGLERIGLLGIAHMHNARFRRSYFMLFLAIPVIAIAALGNRELESAITDQVAANNAGFCRKLGFDPNSATFLTCLRETQELMRRYDHLRTSSGQF
jgi:hypothetical protein